MNKTKLSITIEAKGTYSEKEIQNLCQKLCNFIAGPDGNGLVIGEKFNGEDKTFEVTETEIKRPEETVWSMSMLN